LSWSAQIPNAESFLSRSRVRFQSEEVVNSNGRTLHLECQCGIDEAVLFPGKMIIIGTAIALPLVWLFSIFIIDRFESLDFVKQERNGVRYAQLIYPPSITLRNGGFRHVTLH